MDCCSCSATASRTQSWRHLIHVYMTGPVTGWKALNVSDKDDDNDDNNSDGYDHDYDDDDK